MMYSSTALAVLATVGTALAARPANISICDYYTTALLKDDNSTNQYTLLTLLVNTAVIGNYTKPNVGVTVPGILAKGQYNGTDVNLLPYFDAGLQSTNTNGKPDFVNFLDGGGAAPLLKNMPADDTTSNQYGLLTHLYQYFGVLLGCSKVGTPGFSSYQGDASQYSVHKYMALDPYQIGYFISQVALSAASFGVAESDIQIVGAALGKLFDYKCSPATTVIAAQGAQLQSICTDQSCPLDPNATCAAYPNGGIDPPPCNGNATLADNQGQNCTMSGIATNSSSVSSSINSALSSSSMSSASTAGAMSTGAGVVGGTSAGSATTTSNSASPTTPATYTPGSGAGAVGASVGVIVAAAVFAFVL